MSNLIKENMELKRYKIIERNDKFIVFILKKSSLFFGLFKSEKWEVCYKDIFMPAHFNTLQEAKSWIKLQLKPDVEHSLT